MKKNVIIIASLVAAVILTVNILKKDTQVKDLKMFTSFIGESRPAMPSGGTIIGNKIEELTGVKVEMEYLVGDLGSKAGIMLASGDLPDFINAKNEHYRFRSDGYLIPLEDLIKKHGPNIKRVIGKNWDKYFEVGPDGKKHIYSIPDHIPYGNTNITRPDNAWYIQKIVLEEAGWPQVTTFDEYWNLIEEYKERNPLINGEPTIGFELNADSWYKWYTYETAPERLAGYGDSNFRVKKTDNGWKLEELWFNNDTKRFYKAMNDKYKKGLINQEGFVNTLDQYIQSIASGRVLGTYQPAWVFQDAMDLIATTMPERTYVGLSLSWEKGKRGIYNETRSAAVGMGTSITTSCKDPVGAIKYLDALLTDEIQMLGFWGIEDVDYYRDENGRVNRTPEQNKKFTDKSNDYFYPVWGGEYYNEFWPAYDGSFPDGTATRFGSQPEIFYQDLNDVEKEILDNMGWDTFNTPFLPPSDPEIADRASYRPLWNITPDTGTVEQEFGDRIENDVRPPYYPALMMAENEQAFEKIWSDFEKELTSLEGYKEFKELYQNEVNKRAKL